jgi:hypothetical protein
MPKLTSEQRARRRDAKRVELAYPELPDTMRNSPFKRNLRSERDIRLTSGLGAPDMNSRSTRKVPRTDGDSGRYLQYRAN